MVVIILLLIKKEIDIIITLFTERNWNMWVPGFGSDELRPYKKSSATEAHKQVGQKQRESRPGQVHIFILFE